jgi:CheY-like chemotaxis protein
LEDNLADQKAVIGLLEKSGHRVEAAQDGPGTLAALGHGSFDIVVDAIEATGTIREKEKATGAHLPIVAVAGRLDAGQRERYLTSGADACVFRPVQPTELLQTIERLTRSTAADSAVSQSLKLLSQIRAAISAGDVQTIRHAADALKGSITSVLAKEAFEAASTLEKTVDEDDLVRAQETCRRLREAVISLNPSTGKTL